MTSPRDLAELVEGYLDELALTPELGELAEPIRYALAGGGKRIRPVLCLATGQALGRDPEELLPAGAAVELVHNFSLVHDDLPALDNDELRRGRASTWAQFDEATAVLAGDALLTEAFRLALSYPTPFVARELVQATLGMIGGQHADTKELGYDLAEIHRLKTGRLFYASIACALWVAGLPALEQKPWREFADELGMRPLAAHCNLGLGTIYQAIGRGGEAQAELSTAAEMYRAMEMAFWLQKAATALAQVAH